MDALCRSQEELRAVRDTTGIAKSRMAYKFVFRLGSAVWYEHAAVKARPPSSRMASVKSSTREAAGFAKCMQHRPNVVMIACAVKGGGRSPI